MPPPLCRLLEFEGLDLMAEWASEDVQFWQTAEPSDGTDEFHRMPSRFDSWQAATDLAHEDRIDVWRFASTGAPTST